MWRVSKAFFDLLFYFVRQGALRVPSLWFRLKPLSPKLNFVLRYNKISVINREMANQIALCAM